MRSGEIKALTGLRIFAAVWVVLFHFRPLIEQAAPGFRTALNPVLNCGAQGVDLFFILSGFVLTWNYLDRMGPGWSTRETLHFLWLRLARVWPVYLVTMHLAAAWVVFTLHVGHIPVEQTEPYNAISYLRQLFMVQLWFQPFFDGSSWDGPAWSISAEWLAYLVFGLLVVIIFRVANASRARTLMLLALLAAVPPLLLQLTTGEFYSPWSWLPRIIMQFLAGALACAAVRRLKLQHHHRQLAGYLAIALVIAIIGALYLLDAHPISGVTDSSGVIDILFVPLVIALAIGVGALPALLANRVVVYLGGISFSLYMVHELVHTTWIWTTKQFDLAPLQGLGGKATLLGIFGIALLAAAVLYHGVEEPARKWMRRMVGPARSPLHADFEAFEEGATADPSRRIR